MASPKDVTIHNMVGDWMLNKELSDDMEPALLLQGVPYLVRKVMKLATVSERISETTNPTGNKTLVVAKSAAGLSGQADTFDMSGKEQLVDGGYFGPKVRVSSWWFGQNVADKQLDAYLTQGWIEDEAEGSPRHFAGRGINEKAGVESSMMWGFCEVNGLRYRGVKYHIRKGKQVVRFRMVFSWTEKK